MMFKGHTQREYAPTLWRMGYDGLKYGSTPYIFTNN